METVSYVVRVGDRFVGRNGLTGLEGAMYSHSVKEATALLNLLRTIRAAAPSLVDATIWARGRETLTRVAS